MYASFVFHLFPRVYEFEKVVLKQRKFKNFFHNEMNNLYP